MEQTVNVMKPDMYSKKEFELGSICVAYFENQDECMITYWGKGNVFERIISREGKFLEAVVGNYDNKEVNILEVLHSTPSNLALRRKEISETVRSLVPNNQR